MGKISIMFYSDLDKPYLAVAEHMSEILAVMYVIFKDV